MTLEQLWLVVLPILVQAAGAVALAALPVLTVYAVRWLKAKTAQVQEDLANYKQTEFLYLLQNLARLAIKAAEQEFGGDKGAEKKAYAIKFIVDWLTAHGIEVDSATVEHIATAIEAAVYSEFKKEPTAVDTLD